jgi:hypothetical protein
LVEEGGWGLLEDLGFRMAECWWLNETSWKSETRKIAIDDGQEDARTNFQIHKYIVPHRSSNV